MIAAALAVVALAASAADKPRWCLDQPEATIAATLRAARKDPRLFRELREHRQRELIELYAYKAYAARSEKVCDGLAALPFPSKQERDICRTRYFEYLYVEPLVRRREAQTFAACVDDARWSGLARPDAEKICGLRREQFRLLGSSPTVPQIEAACKVMTRTADAKQKAKCAPYVRAFFGDDGACSRAGAMVSRDEEEHDIEQCRSFAVFARLLAGKAPATDCARRDICRALDGEPAVVAGELAKTIAEKYCGL